MLRLDCASGIRHGSSGCTTAAPPAHCLLQLLRTSEWGALSSTPLWAREGLAEDELISEFQKECRIIRRGLDGDLCKAGACPHLARFGNHGFVD